MENAKKGGEAIVENINFFFGSLTVNPAQPQDLSFLLVFPALFVLYRSTTTSIPQG